jgi:hypothetical protein
MLPALVTTTDAGPYSDIAAVQSIVHLIQGPGSSGAEQHSPYTWLPYHARSNARSVKHTYRHCCEHPCIYVQRSAQHFNQRF